MEQLRNYLDLLGKVGKTRKSFAQEVGIGHVYLSQIQSGFRTPSYRLMCRIERASNGAVPVHAWASSFPEVVQK